MHRGRPSATSTRSREHALVCELVGAPARRRVNAITVSLVQGVTVPRLRARSTVLDFLPPIHGVLLTSRDSTSLLRFDKVSARFNKIRIKQQAPERSKRGWYKKRVKSEGVKYRLMEFLNLCLESLNFWRANFRIRGALIFERTSKKEENFLKTQLYGHSLEVDNEEDEVPFDSYLCGTIIHLLKRCKWTLNLSSFSVVQVSLGTRNLRKIVK